MAIKNTNFSPVERTKRARLRLENRYNKLYDLYKKTDYFMYYFEAQRVLKMYENAGGKKKLRRLGNLVLEADEKQPRFYKNRSGKMVKVPPKTKFTRKRKSSTKKKNGKKRSPVNTKTKSSKKSSSVKTKSKTSNKKKGLKVVIRGDFNKINKRPISNKKKSKK